MTAKSMSPIFKISFQARDINISFFCGAISSRYVQLKSSLSDEENISGETWDNFSRGAIGN